MKNAKTPSELKKALSSLVLSESLSIYRDTAQMSRDLYRDFLKMFSDTPKHKKSAKK